MKELLESKTGVPPPLLLPYKRPGQRYYTFSRLIPAHGVTGRCVSCEVYALWTGVSKCIQ